MPAKQPRVMVSLEPPLHRWVTRTARAEGVSLSLKVRDLLREAYELHEDDALAAFAAERAATFNRGTALTTAGLRRKLGLRRA